MIQAIEDKIVVKLMKRSKSVGGIILPETAQEPQAYGKIISLGQKAQNAGLNVGDVIVSHIRSGMDSVIGYSFVKTLKLDEVYGVLTDKETLEALEDIELRPSTANASDKKIITNEPSRIIRPA